MSRPLSVPSLPQGPETWLAYFRHRADLADRHCSPEVLGDLLGVSGATVRRWEKGKGTPTDEDLVRFAQLCGLSRHQLAFLMSAFRGSKAPLSPDPTEFRANTKELLSRHETPMLLLDDMMYVRAWNGYMPWLGEPAGFLLDSARHPLEGFLEYMAHRPPSRVTSAKLRRAIRSFWRFTAHCSSSCEYRSLIKRLYEFRRFGHVWESLAVGRDSSPIDILGIAELFLPCEGPAFSVSHSVTVFPPAYSVFQFQPANEEAVALLDRTRGAGESRVEFSSLAHWAESGFSERDQADESVWRSLDDDALPARAGSRSRFNSSR